MTKILLVGRAGSGKTHTCLGRLAGAVSAGQRALLLVPTYGQAEHLRYRLLDRIAGLKDGSVETFSSLAERISGLRLSAGARGAVCDGIAEKVLTEHFADAAARRDFAPSSSPRSRRSRRAGPLQKTSWSGPARTFRTVAGSGTCSNPMPSI